MNHLTNKFSKESFATKVKCCNMLIF